NGPQALLPADYTYMASDNGVHSFAATLKTAGSQTLTATDTTTPSMTGTGSWSVAAAAASYIYAFPGTAPSNTIFSTTAGQAFTVTVEALDAYNNIATSFTGTVNWTSSDAQATRPSPYTFS